VVCNQERKKEKKLASGTINQPLTTRKRKEEIVKGTEKARVREMCMSVSETKARRERG